MTEREQRMPHMTRGEFEDHLNASFDAGSRAAFEAIEKFIESLRERIKGDDA